MMTTQGGWDARFRFAQELAPKAGCLALRHFNRLSALGMTLKSPHDPVSSADCEVEQLVKEAIARAFPDDAFLGEETLGKPSRVTWVVDPIDGTANFVRGIPLFGTSLGFVVDGQTEFGVIYLPAFSELYAAQTGQGATLNGERLRVRECSNIQSGLFAVDYRMHLATRDFADAIDGILRSGAEFRRLGSAVVALTSICSGRIDGFWHPELNAWDAIAGLCLVVEAGGWIFNPWEMADLLAPGQVLAASPGIASALAKIAGIPSAA